MEITHTNKHGLPCNICCRTFLYSILWTLLLLVKHGTADSVTQTFRTEEGRERGTLIGTIGNGLGDTDISPPYNPPIFILPSTGERYINVDTSNGDITVKNEPLDRESEDHYRFLVSSEQSGRSITVDIYVTDTNDNKPTFPSAVKPLELSESTPKESKIFLGSAIDADLGNNSTERYEIISGNTDHAFRLKSSKADDGILYLDLVVNGTLDHETNPHYELLIRAFDGGNPPKSGDMLVNITVVDVNDNQPIFSSSRFFAKVLENATIGTSVLQVFATDMDSGDNGKISYAIDRQRSDPQQTFNIDEDTGRIYVNKEVDYESQNAYELIVVARDGAVQKLQTTAVVSIEVLDVNDNEPTIDLIYVTNSGTSRLSENAVPGDRVARLSVSDPDVAEYDPMVNVTLTGGDGHFGLSTSDNVVYFVTLLKPLDRELRPYYRLTVTATDQGFPPLSATKTFTLHITDSNDNPPHFVQSTYRAEIQEVLPAGSSVIQVTAEDEDTGENSRISYEMVDSPDSYSDWFQIDEASGLITTKTRLDCETSVEPELVIVASDTGVPPKSVTATVTVVILDVNDNQPVFDQSFYNVTVNENSAVGDCLLTVSAVDPDCGDNGLVRYSIAADLGFDLPDELTMNAETGQLCIALPLDYESTASYEFPVKASDQDGLHTTAMVKVNVKDVNDNRPVFYPASYSFNLAPNSQQGTEVAVVKATDSDSGNFGTVTYSITSGNSGGYFGIGETSGVITVVKRLPSSNQVYNLQISAQDGAGQASQSTASVTISLVDANSQATPVFSETLYHFSVPENVGVRSFVGTVEAAARGGSLEYSIISGDPNNYFSIDSGSGEIRTASGLDYETSESVLLNIQAQSGNPPSFGRAQVSISISDTNDNVPMFPSDSIEISVKENIQPDSIIYGLRAEDGDSGDNGKITYSLQGTSRFFRVDSKSGDVRLTNSLDYESQKQHTFIVTASDAGSPSETSSVQINIVVQDVNDNFPTFGQNVYAVDLDEDTPVNTRFLQVTATDMDTGSNGLITYSIQQGAYSHVFGVFANDGYLYNKVELDRERTEMYTITVAASDSGIPMKSSTAQIKINILDANDNTPTFVEDAYHFYVSENLPKDTRVGSVRATDSDQRDNDRLRYAIVGHSAAIKIDAQSGELKTKEELDREQREEYSFYVSVTDEGSPPRTATVNVKVTILDINDNDPVFERSGSYPGRVDENQPKGTPVAQVSARDPDKGENSTVTYAFVANNPDTAYFTINGKTGQIFTKEVLDHETKNQYLFSVLARDGGTPARQSTTSVQVRVDDINESPPVFDAPEIQLTVDDGTQAGTVIGHVRAHDRDSGANARIQYYVVDGNLFGTFAINRTTGEVKAAKPVDYEIASSYTIKVQAVDDNPVNPMSSTVPLHINIKDVNDNAPVFEDDPVVVTIRENTEIGTIVHTFYATDKDSGPRGQVRYSIDSQSPESNWFSINGQTGEMKLEKELDYEQITQISVGVVAEDQAQEPEKKLTSKITALVMVEDVNDHSPVFQNRADVTVMEDEPLGFPIIHVIATDDDSHEAGRVTYSIVRGNDKGHFVIDPNSGLLSISNELDREDTSEFRLNISAQDHGHPQHEAFSILTVLVFDVNDNPPSFQHSVYNATIEENMPVDSSVITILATDNDTGENAVLQYIIPDGIADGKFAISSFTGEITTSASLDREYRENWVITAYVKDSAFPSLYDTTTVMVHVLDQNDNAPVFKDSVYRLQVPENTKLTVVHTVVASDLDAGDNGRVTYNIIGGNEDGHFEINPGTGQLSCTDLDRETTAEYNLTIAASDSGSPPRQSFCQVYVSVLDDNDNDPRFLKGLYFTNIPEDIALNQAILTVEAVDPDLGPNSRISYAIDHNAEGLFKIDNTTGIISTAGELDREKKSRYAFEVFATDSGLYGPRTRSVRVDITVDDVNDNPPIFTQVPFKADVAQNSRAGQQVTKVVAEDKDLGVNSDITYEFETQSDYFEINANTGDIKTSRLLDPAAVKLHRLAVRATDAGDPAQSSTGWVEINVGNAPGVGSLRFTNNTYNVYINENSGHGTYVSTVQARFVTGGPGTIAYSFASGNDDNTFSIEPALGQITVNNNAHLDYETNKRLRLIVVATASNAYGYTTVWVNLRDMNDNEPRFTQERYVSSVWEGNTRGTYVTQVSATDEDEGRNGRITYSIIGGNSQNAFVIDPPNTGVVQTNIILDREIKESYRLEIEAIDEGNPVKTSRCTLKISVIDVNDNAPFFPSYPPVTVPEGVQLGTEVLQVTANDVDLKPALTYDFTTTGNPDNSFSIDRYSGRIAVARRLDFETSHRYILEVQASDTVHNVTTRVIVKVEDENDNPPEFSQQSYQVTLPESTGPNYSVLTVSSEDKDSGDNSRISYSMLPVAGFVIDTKTGTISTNAIVQYNPGQPTIHLVVTAHDQGSPQRSAVVAVRVQVIDVNNNAPSFLQSQYKGEVREDQTKGFTILTVMANDADDSYENKKIDYRIASGNDKNVFQISTDTFGKGELILVGQLDRERTPRYDLVVEAKDRGTPAMSSTTAVEITVTDVNDNPPVFGRSVYKTSIDEDAILASPVLTVHAADADTGNNGRVVYEIVSGNDDRKFQIDPNSGRLTVSNNLDYETRKLHRLTVKAQDSSAGPRMSAFTTVIVNVSDVNESGPKFPVLMYIENVYEGETIGSYVFTAHANDDDGGIFGQIEYQILEENMPFEIDPVTGVVKTTEEFIYDQLPSPRDFRFHVQATDPGSYRASVLVSVSVSRKDAAKPRFNKPTYSFSVPGNAKVGYEVGQIIATDADGNSGSTRYYFQEESEYFEIGDTTGLIVVIKDLQDKEEQRKKRWVPRYEVPASLRHRNKRALTGDEVNLVVIATSGLPNAMESTVELALKINRTCTGCAMALASTGSLSGAPLVLVVVFAIIAVILVVVIIIMYLRGRERKRHPPNTSYNDSFDSLNVHAPTVPNGIAPPQYADLHPQYISRHTDHNITTSELSDQSHSASSGRGSAEDGDDVDEEIRMINATPLQTKHLRMPDSGIQQDDDAMSEQSVNNHQEYLARLGIDTSKIKIVDSNSKPVGLASSVESMHQFSDEGGGEGDGMDIQNVYSKMGNMQADETVSAADGIRQYNYAETEPTNPGSLSSVINSEEEFSGSYNWDYLLDWGPQYQPLAHVFSEIARLKDDNIKPKKTPTHIVPQRPQQGQANINAHLNTVLPPPLLTNAPPKAVLAQPMSNRPSQGSGSSASSTNSARTSQLTSLPTPRSPISHDSSFTSPALSPSFTPSLSPLATRSPSISPLATPSAIGMSAQNSGHTTPARSHRGSNPNGITIHMAASSESEQEIHI